MADISRELQAILDARYGEQVRGSIHDAINAVNVSAEGSALSAQNSANSATRTLEAIQGIEADVTENASTATSQASLATEKANEASASATSAEEWASNASTSLAQVQSLKTETEESVSASLAQIEAIKNTTSELSNNASVSETNARQSAESASATLTEVQRLQGLVEQSEGNVSELASNAQASADIATQKASEIVNINNTSMSYAVGGTGTREGEDTDNAKYYSEQTNAKISQVQDSIEQIEQNKQDIDTIKGLLPIISAPFNNSAEIHGEAVLNDTSDNPLQELKVYGRSEQKSYSGKNLLKLALETTTKNGVTCTALKDENNNIVGYKLNGTATADTYFSINWTNTAYPLGRYKLVGCPQGGSISKYCLMFGVDGENTHTVYDEGNGVNCNVDDLSLGYRTQILVKNGVVCNNLIFKPMITTDLSAAYNDFEPYVGGIPSPNPQYPQEIVSIENPSIKVSGRNLLNPTLETTTLNGVTCTKNNDGTYTFNGTVTSQVYLQLENIVLEKGKKYKLIAFTNMNKSTLSVFAQNLTDNSTRWENDENGIFSPQVTAEYTIQIRCCSGTYNNVIAKPMLTEDLSATYDDFEPYKPIQTISPQYTLRSIGDVKDELIVRVDGSGELVQRIEEIDVSTLTLRLNTALNSRRYDYILPKRASTNKFRAISNRLKFNLALKNSFGYFYVENEWLVINDKDSVFSSIDDLKNWLVNNPIYIIYQLATPISHELTPEQVQVILNNTVTYKPTTVISSDQDVDMEVTYVADAKAYIDNRFNELATALVASMGV